ncbi:hypothetical protein [Paraburkholderia sp. J69-2]|uniref:hypothetical protein n=2 Tax=unclassified Paraburkholderia TaxID=2615204 RepID=UPI002AB1E377|nr:hypothetical protein [Paraburkholderia sp. J69-2]
MATRVTGVCSVIVRMTMTVFMPAVVVRAVVTACMARFAVIVIMVVCMRVVVAMTRFGPTVGVIVPRVNFIERRSRRAGISPVGTRPIALRQRNPRHENLDHGRFLPKMTESLNSL